MKLKNIITITLPTILLLVFAFVIGTGFMKRTDVALYDYSVSEDGTQLTFHAHVVTSMGYIRGYKDTGGGVRPHYLTFYSAFGGFNSKLGAKTEFVLELGENDTEIYFNRAGGGYELVLQKDEESGEWTKPDKSDSTEESSDEGKSDSTDMMMPDEEFLVSVHQKAVEMLNEMSLEEKVGQMFIARCPETDAAKKAAEYHLGGYILFGRDFSEKTKAEIIQNIQSYQDAVEIPLFIGVDEEGGIVNRISTNPNLRAVPFRSPQELYEEGGFDLVRSDTEEKCELLHSLEINLNFAPVCDVSQNPDDFIYSRSFGKDANQTAAYVQTVVETMNEQNMGSVLKHFPGYGDNADTHTGVSYDQRPYETFLNSDFLPFQTGIDSGASMVLVSHNVVSCMDEQSPASLSAKVHDILREDLRFSGIIITDDLIMEGVREFAGDTEIAVRAVQAGNDMLCCTDFETQVPAVIEAVEQGKITEDRIDESVLRILEMKISLGMIS